MRADTLVINREGDLGGKKVAMQFDENSVAHLMSVLTDLYSDPVLAVIREYSTNALDSHVEAGNTAPIRVYLPTPLSPYFRVKDFGVGMSVDDIENVYSKYGASTKRDTNEQVGMLGLGCKSALTYTSQFTLVAIKNGIKATVMVSRSDDGSGVMEIVDTCAADEPNGVEVIVPVKHNMDFDRKVKEFFRFWPQGSVLINDAEPDFVKGTPVGEFLVVDNLGSDYVVMGPVAYRVGQKLYGEAYRSFGIVAKVKIGEVNFTPSREDLHYTAKTNATIERIRGEFSKQFRQAVIDDVAKAPSYREAYNRFVDWKHKLGYSMPKDVTYKGEEIPEKFSANCLRYNPNAYYRKVEHVGWVQQSSIEESVIITGFDGDKVHGSYRQKIDLWAENNNVTTRSYYLCKDKPGMPWTEDVKTVDWSVIKAIKLPKRESSGPKAKTTWPTLNTKGYFFEIEELDPTKPILYYTSADNMWRDANVHSAFAKYADDVQIVKIGYNRWDKFKRENPTAIPLVDWIRAEAKRVTDALTPNDIKMLSMNSNDREMAKALNENAIDDPDIVEYIKESKGLGNSTKARREYDKFAIAARHIGWSALVKEFPEQKSVFAEYPLTSAFRFSTSNAKMREHVTIYLNAAYAAKKGI